MTRINEETQSNCREEAHTRATAEARELARDDVKTERLHGAAAESFFRARLEHHYAELSERIYQELFNGYTY